MAKKACATTRVGTGPYSYTKTASVCPYCHRPEDVLDVKGETVTRCLHCGEKYYINEAGESRQY